MPLFSDEHRKFIQELAVPDRVFLVGTLFLYIFRGTTQADIRVALAKRNIQFDLLSWRRQLHSNGLLLRDGKIFAYRSFVGIKDRPALFTLTLAERRLIESALTFPPLRRRLKTLASTEARPALSPAEFDHLAQEVLTSIDLLTYIKKYVRKKMTFLRVSYNVTYAELEMDLITWAQYALLRAYPRFDDTGHGIAVAKTVVKRRGVNLIKSMTAQKQNQLITNADGSCERTTVSLSAIADGTGQFLTADGSFVHRSLLVVGLNGLSMNASNLDWDTQQSFKQLLRSGLLTATHKEFLNLMLGVHSDEFSEWLGTPNEDVLESGDYGRYFKGVCSFLGLPVGKAERFLKSLKSHLGGELPR